MRSFLIFCFLSLFSLSLSAQIGLGNLTNTIKDKALQAKESLKSKAKESIDKKLEKSKAEFDASNFNYAISFSDNSGLFETNEKGTRASGAMLNTKDFLNDKQRTDADRGYGYNAKGEVFFASNNFGSARNMFNLSDYFYSKSDSLSSLGYAQLMNNLALLYQSTARYTKALEYIDKALQLRSQKIPGSEMHAVSVNNKAVLLKDMGRYAEAEKWIDDAVAMSKKAPGEKSLGYALALNNKAMLYQATGRLEKAEAIMKTSNGIAKEILRESSSNYLKLTINLASIYRDMKKYDEAEKIYLDAISIKQRKLGTSHPDYAHLKRGLAALYMEMGKTEEVEKNLNTALDIYLKKFGEENSATAATKADLATFYRMNGKKEKALELMQNVVEVDKKIYGDSHPEYVNQLENLAIAQWINEKIADAAANYKSVIAKTTGYIDDYFSTLSESEKTKFWDKTTPRFHRFNSLVLGNASDASLLELMLNNQLHNKALLLNSSSKVRNQVLGSGDQELIANYNNWISTKEELGRVYSLSKAEITEEHINVDSLENKANALEKSLSEKSAAFKSGNAGGAITYAQVAAVLKPEEAAVEVIQVMRFNNGFNGEVSYAAVILGNAGVPELAVLENGKHMESEGITSYRSAIKTMKPDNSSYAEFWEPIEKKLTGKKKIYVSPDGVYNQVSLLTLKDKNGKYLLDKENIVLVGNTKDILKLKSPEKPKRLKTAFLLGYPNYGSDDIVPSLPGTKAEVENLTKILGAAGYTTTTVMKDDASEAAVKAANAEVLHIATHGFFLADLSKTGSDKVLGTETSAAKKNPLLRSGLMLANCENVFDETGEKATANNGILTAYEVMNLSLDKTDLVVMSACETGLGDVKSGEGVYGLQRSFLVAGAKSVIMSLWEVSDEATMELMTAFYKNYTASGNKQESFLAAQKQIKTKFKDPFYWGAFVLVGN